MRRMCLGLICLVFPVAVAIAQTPPPAAAPPDSEIRRILIDRIDTQKRGVGTGVGPGGADIYRLKFEHGLIERCEQSGLSSRG